MTIAKKLPQLPENVSIIVLQRKGKNDKLKQYTVSRLAVEEALKCLCFGVPCGGLEIEASDMKLYHYNYTIIIIPNTPLNGRYFFYCDVEILEDRLEQLPIERDQYPYLKIVHTEKEIPEEEKGPAPNQFEIPYLPSDETVTTSGITCPLDPKDVDSELKNILQRLTGNNDFGQVGVAEWDFTNGTPLSELKTPGFFAQAFPSIFVNGSCDITYNKLVSIELDN